HASTGNNACAWRELLYNETMMILEKLKGTITYHPVRVGVIDSGVQGSIGQFDDIQLVNLNAPGEPLTDVMGHGTSVAALIGADNKDGGINGLTSRFIGNKLTIFASSKGIRPFKAKTASGSEYETVGVAPFQTIAAIYLLGAAAKADVVNISLGLHGSLPLNLKKGTLIFDTTKFGLMYRYVLQRFDKTLFVISAGNEDTPIIDYNAAWFGGGKLANVLTVGATAHCAPTQRASFSNYGSLVDISAPGEQVPALAYWKKPVSGTFTQNAPGGAPYNVNGTSFSAPIVSAVAALLKSIQPSLTTTQLVQYLKDNAYPASTQIGGMRVNMLAPVVSLLLDNYPGGLVSEVLRDENGLKKSLSIVATELCGGSKIEVKGKGTYLFDPKKDAFDGTWLNGLLTVSLSQNDASYTLRFRGNPEVGKSYPLVTADQFDEGKSGMGTFVFNKVVRTSGFIANGVGGSLKVESCKLSDRTTTGGSGTVSVLANITFKGQMEVVEVPSGETTQKDITGALTVGLFVPALDATLQAFFEKHCK
ncbi:MAG TPA: hypothetical protein DCE42_12125, partial [Myxococcales bacterium]|nr:hypothetical protein [Myxococcales bacterium]